jgi:hypothetical protein
MKPKPTKLTIAILVICLVAGSSCTRTAVVPNSEFETLNSSDARVWRVKTMSNELYSVARFTNTDSMFIVESIIPMKGMDSNGVPYAEINTNELPLAIRYDEIISIEGLYVTDERKIFVLSAIGLTAGTLAFMGLAYLFAW